MPTFRYRAKVPGTPEIRTGVMEAEDRDEVFGRLHRQRLIPIRVTESRGGALRFRTGVSARDVVIFTRQFATMVRAGLPLVQSLDILAEQTEKDAFRRVIREVLYEVESGNTLAEAVSRHPEVFPPLYSSMVAAGEAGGVLDTILERLALFLEKNDALARKIRSAMVYPAVILGVSVAAVFVLLYLVIPTFQGMFASAGIPLPLPTRIVIGISVLVQDYWWAILGLAVGGAFALRAFRRTDSGERAVDGFLLSVPILGDLLRKTAVARFTRTLGTLVASGISILEGLEITARTAGNRVIHDAVMGSRASIAGGETIAGPLRDSGVFPPMVVQMIHVGEQTGGLDEMLERIADFHDVEVDAAVDALLAALEPILIVVLGLVIGGMIISMYLPIFDMIDTVG